jgi:hypothetical protein
MPGHPPGGFPDRARSRTRLRFHGEAAKLFRPSISVLVSSHLSLGRGCTKKGAREISISISRVHFEPTSRWCARKERCAVRMGQCCNYAKSLSADFGLDRRNIGCPQVCAIYGEYDNARPDPTIFPVWHRAIISYAGWNSMVSGAFGLSKS